MTTVNTKKAKRRNLSYASLDDLLKDLDAIEASHAAGTLTTTGNWSAGQVLSHISLFMQGSIDGFPPDFDAPVILKIIAKLLFKKKAVAGGAPPAGFKIPKQAAYLIAPDDKDFTEALAELRAQIQRVTTGGEQFKVPSPLFGTLTHDQWTQLHLGHSTLHLSFLHPGETG